MSDDIPQRLKELERSVAYEAKQAPGLQAALLELCAYETGYLQRRVNNIKTELRVADHDRGQLHLIKKMAQRLKGEFKNDD